MCILLCNCADWFCYVIFGNVIINYFLENFVLSSRTFCIHVKYISVYLNVPCPKSVQNDLKCQSLASETLLATMYY